MKTIQTLLKEAQTTLHHLSEPVRDAEILLCYTLSCTRAFLYAYPSHELPIKHADQFRELYQKRALGYPIAYIIGHRDFWDFTFEVNEHTLIPRPETEHLIEQVLMYAPSKPQTLLDLGTGSGAIALTLANLRPDWHITAVDHHQPTLEMAIRNQARYPKHRVQWIHSDWYHALQHQTFNMIVSNPPYLKENDPHLKQGDLKFEPQAALISGPKGLDALQHIILNAPRYLENHGYLFVEHGYDQHAEVLALFHQAHFKHIESKQDLQGHPRVMLGQFWRE